MPTQNWKIGDCLELLPSIENKSIKRSINNIPQLENYFK